MAGWPGLLARCGIFRFTQLKSGTHPGPISWALGRWGPNCKMKFYLMSTLHPTSAQLFGHKSLHASDCAHCHTTPIKERNFWPFLYSSGRNDGQFWDLVMPLFLIQAGFNEQVPLCFLGAILNKHNSGKRFLTGSLQEDTLGLLQYMKFTFREWCIQIKVWFILKQL